MKKTIKPIYVVVFCLLLLTNACKKNEQSTNIAEQTAVTEKPITISNRAASSDPDATVEITEELFDEMNRGSSIEIKQVSSTHYVAINVLAPNTAPPTSNPCSLPNIIAKYKAYIAANKATFQGWANANCKPFIGCWCYCGMCIMFVFNPTFPPCPSIPPQYKPVLPLFTEIPG